MSSHCFFQTASKNDASYVSVTTNKPIAVAAVATTDSINLIEKQTYQAFAEEFIRKHPAFTKPVCFIFHHNDPESNTIAARIGAYLESAGITVQLGSNHGKLSHDQHVHDLVLQKNCTHVIFINHSDLMQRYQKYSKNKTQKNPQNNKTLDALELKQIRYIANRVKKNGVPVFEILLDNCNNSLSQFLQIQPDAHLDFHQFPERTTILQLIRMIYDLAQQDNLYRKLKEQINNIATNNLGKKPQPTISPFTAEAHVSQNESTSHSFKPPKAAPAP